MESDKVKRDFLNNAINGNLQWDFPFFTEDEIHILQETQGIEKTEHLIGNFFLLDRDELSFSKFLIDMGIGKENSTRCAKIVFLKFGHL